MSFFLLSLVVLYVGRKLGWLLSRRVLYPAPWWLAVILAIVWGVGCSTLIFAMVEQFHPNGVLKWIMGFALGAYVSIPNYGLFLPSTIPPSDRNRHAMVSGLPLGMYVATIFPYAIWGIK